MTTKRFIPLLVVCLMFLILASFAGHSTSVNAQASTQAAPPAGKMRWDIISFALKDGKNTSVPGGVAVASANDGSYIKLTGTGTYGPGASDPVTGGGDWATYDAGNIPIGSGKYTVTAFVGF